MKSIGFNNIIISDFMSEGLELDGNQLILYALIYGFTQDGEWHSTRITYIQKWIPLTQQGITWLITDLKKKGLIEIQKRGRTNYYRICQEPIEAYAKKVASAEEEAKTRKQERGPSPWEKALEKAREEAGLKTKETEDYPEKSERLKKLGEEIRAYDPYADDEEGES